MLARWKAWILLAVVSLHLVAGIALYGYRPIADPSRPLSRESADPDQVVMVLQFPPPARQQPMPGPTRIQPRATTDRASAKPRRGVNAGTGLAQAPSSPRVGPDVLQLTLPPTPPPPIERHFIEQKPTITYEGTQFERGWISEGNLTHVVARRSAVAGVLLSVMGALIEPCTDADRSHYKRGCVQDQYQYQPEDPLD